VSVSLSVSLFIDIGVSFVRLFDTYWSIVLAKDTVGGVSWNGRALRKHILAQFIDLLSYWFDEASKTAGGVGRALDGELTRIANRHLDDVIDACVIDLERLPNTTELVSACRRLRNKLLAL